MKFLKQFLFITVILIFFSGCAFENHTLVPESKIKDDKVSYIYNDFFFTYPKEWGNVEIWTPEHSAESRGRRDVLEFSEGKTPDGDIPFPILEVFTSDYKVSPPFPGEEKTTEVDYVNIDMTKDEKYIASKILTPIVIEATVKKTTIAGKKALAIKEKSYYWGEYLESMVYVFPKYNKKLDTLVISGSLSQVSDLEEIISSLNFDPKEYKGPVFHYPPGELWQPATSSQEQVSESYKDETVYTKISPDQGYIDPDLGLKFSLPFSFEISSEITNYDSQNSQGFFGKEKIISIKLAGSQWPSLYIKAFSKDFKSFYYKPFTGGNLSQFCKENIYVDGGPSSICKFGLAPNSNLKYIFRTEFDEPECSPTTEVRFEFNNPNQNSEYRGIDLSVYLEDFGKEFTPTVGCVSSPEFDAFVERRLKEGLEEKNLTAGDKKLLDVAKEILNSIQKNSFQITQIYEDTKAGFRFQYPVNWEKNTNGEQNNSFTLFDPETINGVAYKDYITFQVSPDSFQEIKKKIEDQDRIESGESLSKYLEVKNTQLKGISAVTGFHSTAIGINEFFYYFPLKTQKGGLYIEFRDRTSNVDSLLQTLEIF